MPSKTPEYTSSNLVQTKNFLREKQLLEAKLERFNRRTNDLNEKTARINTQLASLKTERQKLNTATQSLEAKLTEFRAQKQLVKSINEATITLNSQSAKLNEDTNLLNKKGLQTNLTMQESYIYIQARNKHSKALFQHAKALREHAKTCQAYEQNKLSIEKLDDFFSTYTQHIEDCKNHREKYERFSKALFLHSEKLAEHAAHGEKFASELQQHKEKYRLNYQSENIAAISNCKALNQAIATLKTPTPFISSYLLPRIDLLPLSTPVLDPTKLEDHSEALISKFPVLACPIDANLLSEAMILPSGHSYNNPLVLKWLNDHHSDPLTSEPCSSGNLRPNKSIIWVIKILSIINETQDPELKKALEKELLECFKDPEKEGEFLTSPIVDESGNTMQSEENSKYKNRVLIDLLNDPYIIGLLAKEEERKEQKQPETQLVEAKKNQPVSKEMEQPSSFSYISSFWKKVPIKFPSCSEVIESVKQTASRLHPFH